MQRVYAHVSALKNGNFVSPEFILNRTGDETAKLLKRTCPHRMYMMHSPGQVISEVTCDFHGFKWDKIGNPINNDKKISCGEATVGKSGLIFNDFIEPDHKWVTDVKSEVNLEYSHSRLGKSKGSWLWMMDIQADLLHVTNGTIHPSFENMFTGDDIKMDEGDGWILQSTHRGWWLFIYPFTFIEWTKGCLSVNYTIPDNYEKEMGFSWITQFYFDPLVSKEDRIEFETLEDVFIQDVQAVENQTVDYFPLKNACSPLEEHCIHYGEWVSKNRKN